MNKEVFLRAGGLNYLLQLLRLVHTTNWTTSSRHFKQLEIVLLETLHPLAACFRFRRFVGFNVIIAVNTFRYLLHSYQTIGRWSIYIGMARYISHVTCINNAL